MKVTYSKGVCLLSNYASANLYGGQGGTTGGDTKHKNSGSTTTPTVGVIPKGSSPEPAPDI